MFLQNYTLFVHIHPEAPIGLGTAQGERSEDPGLGFRHAGNFRGLRPLVYLLAVHSLAQLRFCIVRMEKSEKMAVVGLIGHS